MPRPNDFPLLRAFYDARVAQLVRATGLHPVGRGFESLLAYQSSFRAKQETKTVPAYRREAGPQSPNPPSPPPPFALLYAWASQSSKQRSISNSTMTAFFYVYILISDSENRHYVGVTIDLNKRLEDHNRGAVFHTSKYRPWKIQTAIAFDSKEKAYAFERYLKSHAGREYAKRHF